MGAASAVLAGNLPVVMGAAKSRCGHAESAAGAVGLAHGALKIKMWSSWALVHLRALNPLIRSVLDPHMNRGLGACMLPRQTGPGIQGKSSKKDQNLGVSAFAFQARFTF